MHFVVSDQGLLQNFHVCTPLKVRIWRGDCETARDFKFVLIYRFGLRKLHHGKRDARLAGVIDSGCEGVAHIPLQL